VLLDGLLGGNDNGTGTVRDTGGVSGGDGSLLLEDGGELVEGLDGGCGAGVLIVAEGLDVLLDLVLDGDDLGVEATGLVGYFGSKRILRIEVLV
jgi:hypothetical protein